MGNIYLKKNYKNSDWFNGMTPARLDNLKGRIKKIDHKEYELENDKKTLKLINSGTPTFSFLFNECGEIIKEISNGGKAIIYYKNFIENKVFRQEWLDNASNLIQYETFDYGNDSDFATSFYIKRVDGSEKSLKLWIENLNEESFVYHGKDFDSLYVNGKLIEKKATYSSLIIKYDYFDEYYIESTFSNGILDKTEKFNQNDYLIELLMFDDKGLITQKEIRKYDCNNNLIEKNSHLGIPEHFIYNDTNLLIEKKRLSRDFEMHTVREYEYDSYGNLIKERGDWKNSDYKYTYDLYGNWIERIEMEGNNVLSKATREIEYYI